MPHENKYDVNDVLEETDEAWDGVPAEEQSFAQKCPEGRHNGEIIDWYVTVNSNRTAMLRITVQNENSEQARATLWLSPKAIKYTARTLMNIGKPIDKAKDLLSDDYDLCGTPVDFLCIHEDGYANAESICEPDGWLPSLDVVKSRNRPNNVETVGSPTENEDGIPF